MVYLYEDGALEGRLWLYTDHRGSVVAEADDSGTATATYTYGPFGEMRRGHGPGAHLPPLDRRQPFRFTGRMWDASTGLSFHAARFYSPALGRFLSPDPAGYADGLNLYAYAGNDPVNFVDPSGMAMEITGGMASRTYSVVSEGLDHTASLIGSDIRKFRRDPLGEMEEILNSLGPGGQAVAGAGKGVLAIAGIARAGGGAAGGTAALSSRAQQIHSALDPIAQSRRTTAVLRTNSGDIVASGGRGLTPAQRSLLKPGETAATLPGAHAEVTALHAAQKAGSAPRSLAVTRAICPRCAEAIEASGGVLTSPTTAVFP